MLPPNEEPLKDQQNMKFRKRLKLILLILAPIIIITIIVVIIIKYTKKNDTNLEQEPPDILTEFNLSTFFFFDPVSNTPCTEKNYWTIFDNDTTCYRWISITHPDTNTSNKIKLMLDHNIGVGDFINYKSVLKEKTKDWARYKDEVDIIDEDSIFQLMKYENKPDKINNKIIPTIIVNPYSAQSFYILDGKMINEKGYWTKTSFDDETAYAIDFNGNNEVIPKSSIYGIRPIINIKKSLLKTDSGILDITELIKTKSNYIHIDIETELYDGYKYEVLQGITTTEDKLFFMSSNNINIEKGVMYSYQLNNLNTIYKKDYSDTGHGNGMTYNSKKGKILTLGYYGACEYNKETLIREKNYTIGQYPGYSAIGYDYESDLYVGRANHRIFFADTENMRKKYEFGTFTFETTQDLEYFNGYIFDCASDFGLPHIYQVYSFYPGYEIIYIYSSKFDVNKKPDKNFGKFIKRLSVKDLGELESISFRNGNVYFGFGKKGYNFYVLNYELLNKFLEDNGIVL